MILKHIVLLLMAFIIQSTLVENLAISSIKPDFILILLFYAALQSGSLTGVILGFSIGLLQDFYGPPGNLGLNALCKSIIGFGAGIGKEGLYKDNLSILLTAVFVSFITHDLIYHIIETRFSLGVAAAAFINISLLSAVYTAVISLLLILFFTYRRGQIHVRRLFPE